MMRYVLVVPLSLFVLATAFTDSPTVVPQQPSAEPAPNSCTVFTFTVDAYSIAPTPFATTVSSYILCAPNCTLTVESVAVVTGAGEANATVVGWFTGPSSACCTSGLVNVSTSPLATAAFAIYVADQCGTK